MAIIIHLDVMLARRKMSVTELTEKVGITMANLSILKMVRRRPSAFRHLTPFARPWIASQVISWNTAQRRHDTMDIKEQILANLEDPHALEQLFVRTRMPFASLFRRPEGKLRNPSCWLSGRKGSRIGN